MSESAVKSRNERNERNKRNIRNQRRSAARKLRKNRMGLIPVIAVTIIVALLALHLWNNWTMIGKNKEKIDALTQEYNHKRIKNDASQQKVDAQIDEDYIIDVARDNGYGDSDEIIFYFNNGE